MKKAEKGVWAVTEAKHSVAMKSHYKTKQSCFVKLPEVDATFRGKQHRCAHHCLKPLCTTNLCCLTHHLRPDSPPAATTCLPATRLCWILLSIHIFTQHLINIKHSLFIIPWAFVCAWCPYAIFNSRLGAGNQNFVTIGFTTSRLHCTCGNKISLFDSRKALHPPPESNMLKSRDAHTAASLKLLHFSRHYCWHALQESQTVKQTLQRN